MRHNQPVKLRFSGLAFFRSIASLATKCDLKQLEHTIMSAISDFASRQNAFNTRIDSAVEGIQTDVTSLREVIEKLQNTPGAITPEDQALLDTIERRAEGLTTKLEALNAMEPPVVPAG